MNELTKPNDILIATLNAPEASTLDLLKNNINASNTSLYDLEFYKRTPFVQLKYTKNGVFDDLAFNLDYLKAYQLFYNLSQVESYENLVLDLEYSPTDRFRPLNSKTFDTSVKFERNKDPFLRNISYTGINEVSQATKTPYELAQLNHIWDPEKGEFIDETPESMNLFKKINGRTMVYAKYQEDTLDIDPLTGELRLYRKGEWKLDPDGKFYTEFVLNKDIMDLEVVNLQDILTKEDSWLNKIDFMDSDDVDKSIFGITMKTLVTVAPYFIPGVREYYAGLSTIFGLFSVMPTFYKSIESIFAGEDPTYLNEEATALENWFRKFEPSKTMKGKSGFWNYESIAGMVADTVGQLFQLRTAAKAAQLFLGKAPDAAKVSSQEFLNYWQKSNRLSTALNLGYMGLVSTSDIYNEALKAGYDKQTAGVVSLVSAAALFGIMEFNSTARGLGNWFLDKTTGYNAEVASGVINTAAKNKMNEFAVGWQAFQKGDKKLFINTLTDFKNSVKSKVEDVLIIGGEKAWKQSIVEGVEEVSEEVIQDMVKGMTDVCSYLGWTGKQGSFGGWDNVFSKEGLERYLATFVGGAVGGAIFVGTDKLDNALFGNTTTGEKAKYDIDQAILDGRGEELIESVKRHRKYFNTRLTPTLVNVGDTQVFAVKGDETKSLADVIVDLTIAYIRGRMAEISRFKDLSTISPTEKIVYETIARKLQKTGFDEHYVMKKWKGTVEEAVQLSDQLKEELKKSDIELDKAKIKSLKELLESKQEELTNWTNGEHFRDFSIAGLLTVNDQLVKHFTSLDLNSFARSVYGRDFSDFPVTSDKAEITLELIKSKWEAVHGKNITSDNMVQLLDDIIDILKVTIPKYTQHASNWEKLKNQKVWLHQFSQILDNKETSEVGYNDQLTSDERAEERRNLYQIILKQTPKYWTNSDAIKLNIADELESSGAIDLSGFETEELKIIKNWINDLASSFTVNVWDGQAIAELVNTINYALANKVNNAFTLQLSQIKSEEGEQALNDISTKKIQFNIAKVNPITSYIKAKTILDIVENDEIIDEELYQILQNIFEQELALDYAHEITTLLNKKIGESTLLDIINDDNLYETIDFTDGSQLESVKYIPITINNIKENISQLNDLFSRLAYIQESYTNGVQLTTNLDLDITLIPEMLDNLTALLKRLNTTETDELKAKWEVIKNKVHLESPLLTMIKDFLRSSGVNEDKMNIVDKIYNLSIGVQSNSELTPYTLSDQDLEILIKINQALDFIEGLVAATNEIDTNEESYYLGEYYNTENGITGEELIKNLFLFTLTSLPSVSKVIRQYLSASGLSGQEQFVTFGENTSVAIRNILQSLRNKTSRLLKISEENIVNDFIKDQKCRLDFHRSYLDWILQHNKITIDGKEYVLHTRKPGNIEDPEKEIFEIESELHNSFLEILKERSSEELLNAFLENLPDSWTTDKTLREGIPDNSEKKISSSILFSRLLRVIAISPKELTEKYIKGIEGKSLYPRFDQEWTLQDLIAYDSNQELYSLAQLLLNQKWGIGKELLPYSQFISGPGGSGKSTLIDIYLKSIDAKKVILTATTKDKVQELVNSVTIPSDGIIDKDALKTVREIFGTDYLNKFESEFKRICSELTEEDCKGTITREIELDDIKINILLTFDNLTLKAINFDPKSREAFKHKLTDDLKISETTIIIDEATNLSPLDILLFELIEEIDPTNKVKFLGDETLLGYIVMINGIEYPISISSFSMSRPHLLNGAIRFLNTASIANVSNLYNIAKNYVEYARNYTYSVANDKGLNEIKLAIRDSFNGELKYKISDTELFGHYITSDETDFKLHLKQVLDSNKSLTIIYDGLEASKNQLTEILKTLGLEQSDINNLTWKTLENVQGSESENVIMYNLKSVDPKNNGDVDIKRLYTAATRAKQFSLIFDPEENGLFKAFDLVSVEDSKAREYVVNSSIFKLKLDERIAYLKTLIPSEETKEESKKESVHEEKNNSISEEETDSDLEEDPTPETKEESEGNEIAVDESNPDKPKIISKEPKHELTEKEKQLKERLKEILGDDVAKIYTYYVRLGLTRALVEELKKLHTIDDIKAKIDSYNITGDDLHKDFIGFINSIDLNNFDRTDPFMDLIDAFITKRNALIYSNTLTKFGIHMKQKDLTSWSWMKPNDNIDYDEEHSKGNIETTLVAESNGVYFTIGQIGMNDDKTGTVFSQTLYDMSLYFIHNKPQYLTLWGEFTEDTNSSKYFEYRNLNSDQIELAKKSFPKFLIKSTGLNSYLINTDPEATHNGDYKIPGLQFGRLPVSFSQALGFNVVLKSFETRLEFKEWLANLKYSDEWDLTELVNNWTKDLTWAIIYPKGGSEELGAPARLLLSCDGTIFDNLKLFERSQTLQDFALYLIISYFAYKANYPIAEELTTKNLTKGKGKAKQRNTDLINKWILYTQDLVKSEGFKTAFPEMGDELIIFVKEFLKADPRHTNSIKSITKSQLKSKYSKLANVLLSDDSKYFTYTYVTSDNLGSVFTLRAFEFPQGYLSFANVRMYKNGENPYYVKNITDTAEPSASGSITVTETTEATETEYTNKTQALRDLLNPDNSLKDGISYKDIFNSMPASNAKMNLNDLILCYQMYLLLKEHLADLSINARVFNSKMDKWKNDPCK